MEQLKKTLRAIGPERFSVLTLMMGGNILTSFVVAIVLGRLTQWISTGGVSLLNLHSFVEAVASLLVTLAASKWDVGASHFRIKRVIIGLVVMAGGFLMFCYEKTNLVAVFILSLGSLSRLFSQYEVGRKTWIFRNDLKTQSMLAVKFSAPLGQIIFVAGTCLGFVLTPGRITAAVMLFVVDLSDVVMDIAADIKMQRLMKAEKAAAK